MFFNKKFILVVFYFILSGFPDAAQAAETGSSVESPVIKSIRLRTATMEEAAQLLSMGSNMKIAVSKGAAREPVTVYLKNITLEDALKTICSMRSLWYRQNQETGVIHVMTLDELKVGVNLYGEDFLEVITIYFPLAVDVGETLQGLFRDRVRWFPPDDEMGDPYDLIDRALTRMDLVAERGQFVDGQGSSGSGNYAGGNNSQNNNSRNQSNRSNNNRNYPSGYQNGNRQQFFSDTRDGIESECVNDDAIIARTEGSTAPLPELTGKPGVVYVTAFPINNALLLRSNDLKSMEQVKKIIAGLDTPKPQVLLEVKVLELDVGVEDIRGVDWLFASESGTYSGASQASGMNILRPDTLAMPIVVDDPKYADADFVEQFTRIGEDGARSFLPIGTGVDPRAYVFRYLTDSVKARLALMQEDNRIKRLATPSLLVADNEASRLFIGSESTIIEQVDKTVETTTTDGTSNTTEEYTATTSRQRIGTTLLLTPKIHADGTVTLRLLQEESSRGDKHEEYFSEDQYFVSYDVDKRSITTTIVAKDGHIVAVGGLVRENVTDQLRAVPFLHTIPLIGELFKHTTKIRSRSELLVLIRPTIILAPDKAQEGFEAFIKRNSKHPSATPEVPDLEMDLSEDRLITE